jgi:hypothetical protein
MRSWRAVVAAGALATVVAGAIVSTPAAALADPAARSDNDSTTALQCDWGIYCNGFEVDVFNNSSQPLKFENKASYYWRDLIIPPHGGKGTVKGHAPFGSPWALYFRYNGQTSGGYCEIDVEANKPFIPSRDWAKPLTCSFHGTPSLNDRIKVDVNDQR